MLFAGPLCCGSREATLSFVRGRFVISLRMDSGFTENASRHCQQPEGYDVVRQSVSVRQTFPLSLEKMKDLSKFSGGLCHSCLLCDGGRLQSCRHSLRHKAR